MKSDKTRGAGWIWAINGLAIIACLVIILNLVWRRDANELDLGQPGHPLVFMLSPDYGRDLTEEDRAWLADFLERESGLRIDVKVAGSSLEAIESFGAQADIGLVNLFDYILARREYGVSAALQVLRGDGQADYRGGIAVRAADPYRQLTDLAGRRLAFVDPFSTSGFIFPAKLLKDAALTIETEFAGGHAQALERLLAGHVDAATTFTGAIEADSRLRVLATTDLIPNEPVIVRNGVRPEKADLVLAALTRLAATPEGKALFLKMAAVTGFKAVTNEHYDPVVGVARSAGATVYDLVPAGVQVESRRRGIDLFPL
jgi:phosphonate transport system substrate-binding protein